MVCRHIGAALIWLLFVPLASAQEDSAAALLAELGNRQTAMESIQSLERLAARIVHVESLALLSRYGDWPEEEAGWGGNFDIPKFVYDVRNIYFRFTSEVPPLRRVAARQGVFSDDERARFLELLDDLDLLVEDSRAYYDLLVAGNFAEANEFFCAKIRAPYRRIVDGSYTIGLGISRDISRIGLQARALQ
jgi:hypothetical protein